jgi:hypothetical protein
MPFASMLKSSLPLSPLQRTSPVTLGTAVLVLDIFFL